MKKALFIGGTGVISLSCTRRLLDSGEWEVTLFNRGSRPDLLPAGVKTICGDIGDEAAAAAALQGKTFDVVADFIAFTAEQAQRDVRLFAGRCGQYVFISSASAYQKPPRTPHITESTPLYNPYWQYSRDKIACEEVLTKAYREQGFPVTIVRPSHTYDARKIPVQMHGDAGSFPVVERIRQGKPVVVAGDGTSLWTITHSRDFAVGFTGLMGNPAAVGETFHITSDESVTWNQIYDYIGAAVGRKPQLCHVSSQMLLRSRPQLEGPLLGDKINCVLFDNSKIKRFVPGFCARIRADEGIYEAVSLALRAESRPQDPAFDAWCDEIALRAAAF